MQTAKQETERLDMSPKGAYCSTFVFLTNLLEKKAINFSSLLAF